jgi:glycosyltransferase involved in cell wall biosynthesis
MVSENSITATTTGDAAPLISVVIPSRQRPALLIAAVQSVLEQKRNDLEVIVVLDGDTAGSAEALRRAFPKDARIRILENTERRGAPVARNQGIAAARGKWIAHLDDDDTWLPGKIDKQLACALASRYSEPVVTCQFFVRAGGTKRIYRIPPPTLPISEYLFARTGLFGSTGSAFPSIVLAPRSLLLRIPIVDPKHEDCEWAMRASLEPTVGWEFVAEPLAIWNCDSDGRERITTSWDWRYSLEFARSHKALMTRRAYAGFILSRCTTAAVHQKEWRAFFPIFAEAIRRGSPRVADLVPAMYASLGVSAPGRWLKKLLRPASRLLSRTIVRDERDQAR